MRVAPHTPKAPIRLQKKAVVNSTGNLRHRRRLDSNCQQQQQNDRAKNPDSLPLPGWGQQGLLRCPQDI
jgi:hypothetical protein